MSEKDPPTTAELIAGVAQILNDPERMREVSDTVNSPEFAEQVAATQRWMEENPAMKRMLLGLIGADEKGDS